MDGVKKPVCTELRLRHLGLEQSKFRVFPLQLLQALTQI